jgi:K+ transporter
VLLTLAPTRRPYVEDGARVSIKSYCDRLTVVRGTFGFMERPSIKPILEACRAAELRLDSADTPFFYADPKIVSAAEDPLPRWVRKYFEFLNHNAFPLSDDLRIPPERRVELGVEVAI